MIKKSFIYYFSKKWLKLIWSVVSVGLYNHGTTPKGFVPNVELYTKIIFTINSQAQEEYCRPQRSSFLFMFVRAFRDTWLS